MKTVKRRYVLGEGFNFKGTVTYQKFDDASTYFVHIPCGNVGEEYHLILEPIIPRKRRK